jgi:hypothetical protein
MGANSMPILFVKTGSTVGSGFVVGSGAIAVGGASCLGESGSRGAMASATTKRATAMAATPPAAQAATLTPKT